MRVRSQRFHLVAATSLCGVLFSALIGCDGPPAGSASKPQSSDNSPPSRGFVLPSKNKPPDANVAANTNTPTPPTGTTPAGTPPPGGEIIPLSPEDFEPTSGSAVDDLTAFRGLAGTDYGREHIVRSTPLHRAEGALVYASAPSELIYDGERVVDVRTGKDMATFSEPRGAFISQRALSPDGRVYVVSHPGEKMQAALKSVPTAPNASLSWIASKTGKVAFEVPAPSANVADFRHLEFVNAGLFMAIYKSGAATFASVYQVRQPKVAEANINIGPFGDGEVATRADGNYAAFGDGAGNGNIYNLKEPGQPIPLALPPLKGTEKNPTSWPKSLTFSPTGDEIAAIFQNRVVCWDLKGAVVYDELLPIVRVESPYADSLAWSPDGSGWFVRDHYMFLRKEKMVAWQMQYSPAGKSRFLSKDELLFVWNGGLGKQDVSLIPPPWDLISKATAATETLYRTGDPVLLNLKIGEVRFAPRPDVERGLVETLSSRFATAPNGSMVGKTAMLEVTYSEVAAPAVVGKATGTICKLQLQMTIGGAGAPIWQSEYDSSRSMVTLPETNEQSLRELTFKLMQLRLQQLAIPSLIPKNPALPRLPITSDIERKQ